MIVCGVDDSEGAGDAARVAARLGAELDLPVVLVHVVPPPVGPTLAPAPLAPAPYAHPTEREYDAAMEAANTLLDQIATQLDTAERVTRRAVVGDPTERLRAITEELGARLLVVGSRGRGLIASALLGSVSSALAGDAPCPVVVVPPGSRR